MNSGLGFWSLSGLTLGTLGTKALGLIVKGDGILARGCSFTLAVANQECVRQIAEECCRDP